MLTVILNFVLGYIVGSIPFSYILTLRSANVDIRKTGSGNVGGYNAYIATHSVLMGVFAGLLDAFKGLFVVLASIWLFPASYLTQCVALLGALAGHNYSIWLRFKGGRGLATAAGGMSLLGAGYAAVWCVSWFIAKKLKCDILRANLVAIMVTPPILWVIPWKFTGSLVAVQVESDTFLFFSCILSAVLLLSHQDVVRDVWKGTRSGDAETSSLTK